ncbi:MAG: flagellar export protein FliJ [Planctomycetota bacterium]
MRFQFRFEVLLSLRRRERDEAGAFVGQAHQAIAKIDQQIDEVDQERIQIKAVAANQAASAQPKVDQLLHSGRYELQLQFDREGLLDTKAKLQQELERRLELLREAEWEVKRMEQLRDKDKEQFDQLELKREQAIIDEAAARSRMFGQALPFDRTSDDGVSDVNRPPNSPPLR